MGNTIERNEGLALEKPVTAKAIADALGVTQQTITAKARRKELPHIRLGKTYRFRLSEVLEHVNRAAQ